MNAKREKAPYADDISGLPFAERETPNAERGMAP
jgi:hypothetical protein